MWTGWYIGIFGLAINKDRWAKEMAGKATPATWDDLLNADLKGKLDFPDPVKTGGGYIFLATQVFRFNKDEAKAMDYMKKLHANIGQYVGTSPQGIELVGQGQFLMGPNWGHDILTAANKGQPIEFKAPADTANEIGAISIVKGGPNTAAAKAFVDWVLTKEAGRAERQALQPPVGPQGRPARARRADARVGQTRQLRPRLGHPEQGPPDQGLAASRRDLGRRSGTGIHSRNTSKGEPQCRTTLSSLGVGSSGRGRYRGRCDGGAAAGGVRPDRADGRADAPRRGRTDDRGRGQRGLPRLHAVHDGPKPDFPADGPMYDDGFNSYPANPVKALPQAAGHRRHVNIMSIQLFPPPTPLDQNPAWQAVNKALNANVNFQIVTSADYPVKLGTVMAGNDMPDLLYMYSRAGRLEHAGRRGRRAAVPAGPGGRPDARIWRATRPRTTRTWPPSRPPPGRTPAARIRATCTWSRSTAICPGQMFVKNANVWDKEFGADYVPKNADDFKRVLQPLTKPQQDFYGIGARAGHDHDGCRRSARSSARPTAGGSSPAASSPRTSRRPSSRKRSATCATCTRRACSIPTRPPGPAASSPAPSSRSGKFAIFRDPINGWQDAWRQALQSRSRSTCARSRCSRRTTAARRSTS